MSVFDPPPLDVDFGVDLLHCTAAVVARLDSQCETLRALCEFVVERASMEERYARSLASLERQICGRVYGGASANDVSTVKVVEALHSEAEAVSASHSHVASGLQVSILPVLQRAFRDAHQGLKKAQQDLHRQDKMIMGVNSNVERMREKYLKACRTADQFNEKGKSSYSGLRQKLEGMTVEEKGAKLFTEAQELEELYKHAVEDQNCLYDTVLSMRRESLRQAQTTCLSAARGICRAAEHIVTTFYAAPRAILSATEGSLATARSASPEEDLRQFVRSLTNSTVSPTAAGLSRSGSASSGSTESAVQSLSSSVASSPARNFDGVRGPSSAPASRDDPLLAPLSFIPFEGLRPWAEEEDEGPANAGQEGDADLGEVDAGVLEKEEEIQAHVDALLDGDLRPGDHHELLLRDSVQDIDGRTALVRILTRARSNARQRQLPDASFDALVSVFKLAVERSDAVEHARVLRLLLNMSQTFSRQNGSREYLSDHIRGHSEVLQDMRFWEAAFFDAVQSEKEKFKKKHTWRKMKQQEREEYVYQEENIVFGQLGSYALNMPAFGVSSAITQKFLQKMMDIHELPEEYRSAIEASTGPTSASSGSGSS